MSDFFNSMDIDFDNLGIDSAVSTDIDSIQSELSMNLGNSDDSKDDDIFGSFEQNGETDHIESDPFSTNDNNDDDFIQSLFKAKGYKDLNDIVIINENGMEEHKSLAELTPAERYDILTAPDVFLSNEEKNVINLLRKNNTTLKDILQYNAEQAVQNYLNSQQSSFIVDQATDEQLFLADLKSKYPTLTEEELNSELEDAMLDEDIFAKKIAVLRQQYKQIEEEERAMKVQESERAKQEELQNSIYAMNSVAQQVDDLYDFELTDNDKDDVMRHLFELDVNGKSEFYKRLQDPNELFRLAWFSLKGDEAFSEVHSYYKKEIETAKRGGVKNANTGSRTSSVQRRQSAQTPEVDKYGLSDYLK